MFEDQDKKTVRTVEVDPDWKPFIDQLNNNLNKD